MVQRIVLVGVALISCLALAALVVVVALPDDSLRPLETVGVKRLIVGIGAALLILAAAAVYFIAVPPSRERFICMIAFMFAPPLVSGILFSAGKPEYFRVTQGAGPVPNVELKFGGFDYNAVLLVGMTLLFLFGLVLVYKPVPKESADVRDAPEQAPSRPLHPQPLTARSS